jgi:hypothetical protein
VVLNSDFPASCPHDEKRTVRALYKHSKISVRFSSKHRRFTKQPQFLGEGAYHQPVRRVLHAVNANAPKTVARGAFRW